MDIKNFFDDKDKVESFLKAKTEQEARSILESECGKVSDDEFNEIKKGFLTAVSEEAFEKVSGGFDVKKALTSETALNVFTGAILTIPVITGGIILYETGKEKGRSDVKKEYDEAAAEGVESWVNKAGVFNYEGVGNDPTYHHIVPKE